MWPIFHRSHAWAFLDFANDIRRLMPRFLRGFLLCVLAGCTDSASTPRTAGTAARWRVDPIPILSLGATDADTSHEFSEVSGAVRMPNGEIVVSDNGSRQLRWFSANGERLGTSGRRGAGPGEFIGRITVARLGADTVVAWDEKLDRWSVFDSSRRFVRLLDRSVSATDSTHRMIRVVNRSMIVGVYAGVGVPEWVDAVVDSLRRSGALGMAFREGILDDAGLLWLRAPGDSVRWDVIAPDASMLGSVTLPQSFEPYQVSATEVLGKFTDTTGFEFVHAYRLDRPRAALTAVTHAAIAGRPAADTAAGWDRQLRKAAMALVTAEEAYYADHMTYANDARKISHDGTSGLIVAILSADRVSWRGTLTDKSNGAMCVLVTGGTRWPVFEQTCSR